MTGTDGRVPPDGVEMVDLGLAEPPHRGRGTQSTRGESRSVATAVPAAEPVSSPRRPRGRFRGARWIHESAGHGSLSGRSGAISDST
jgi:hypothetical protein